jgi:hypothetical protein
MTTEANSTTETRIRNNAHFARILRQRLISRHGNGALRKMLAQICDQELIYIWPQNERQGREHSARLRAEKRIVPNEYAIH